MLNRRRMLWPTVIMSIVVVAGCAAGSSTTNVADNTSAVETSLPGTETSATETTVQTTAPSGAAGTDQGSTPVSDQIDPGLKPFIDIAVADLAKRLSIADTDIGVTSATLVVWPDGALGCPQPGQVYAQVTTDGSLIVLTANGTEYRYHAGGSTKPFLCEQPAKSPPTTG